MQSAPRPPASVPLGGSLRASRAAQLARPDGPLAAVDLADGRAFMAEPRGARWIAVPAVGGPAGPPAPVADEIAPAPSQPLLARRRVGAAAALAAALGAVVVALATGFSGTPSPAAAAPVVAPAAPAAPTRVPVVPPRGGHALPRTPRPVAARAAAALPPPPAPPAAVVAPPPAPVPPPLPELPSAPAL